MSAPHPRVLVLAGGLSHERDVSLRSGRRVAEALRATGCEVLVHDVDAHLIDRVRSEQPDVVWPLLHGASGEDGSVADVLELLGVRFVGAGPRATRASWNKAVTKSIVAHAGVSTPDYVTLPQSLFSELGAATVLDLVVESLGLPLVVKPARGGSALGVTLVRSREDMARAMVTCFSYDEIALIEQAVDGTEVAVSVLATPDGLTALPAVEIVTDGPYDFDARYNPGRTEYFAPARLPDDVARRVAETAVAAHEALALRHLSRSDLIVRPDGSVEFLEVNTSPGQTETSLFPQAVAAADRSLADVYRSIVDLAAATPRRREAASLV
ncbi:D-alanine--D-alanine ligase [Flavimobilis marinus]|uniref:D-alanine--D-alanine ligase n=1 Tax=Flavimobilis marinus TaxID=285351 RepID=A0A1I2HRR3_9MICO|nr:D-alanine--D-alanine ligase [Flavimobilis marinus]GHG48964.1 D-alanine--D-alanine ligase [Flavimobilis marinus]SFF32915.1 D-alanine--D-alanine ligase [Flavimobilis marinus]